LFYIIEGIDLNSIFFFGIYGKKNIKKKEKRKDIAEKVE
jgi:hypothetical protein